MSRYVIFAGHGELRRDERIRDIYAVTTDYVDADKICYALIDAGYEWYRIVKTEDGAVMGFFPDGPWHVFNSTPEARW